MKPARTYIESLNFCYSLNFFCLVLNTERQNSNVIHVSVSGLRFTNFFSITCENIFFEVNRYELQSSSIVELEKVFKMLELNKEIQIEISGHTDNDGNDDDNMKLSENRAKSVVDWLVNKGISSSRLSYKGFGETRPIVENSSKENKAKNRRTELTIK